MNAVHQIVRFFKFETQWFNVYGANFYTKRLKS